MSRIIFHRGKCIGCNACVEAAPNRWRMSKKDGRCNLIGAKGNKGVYLVEVPYEEYEENRMAAEHCPQNIIKVEE